MLRVTTEVFSEMTLTTSVGHGVQPLIAFLACDEAFIIVVIRSAPCTLERQSVLAVASSNCFNSLSNPLILAFCLDALLDL